MINPEKRKAIYYLYTQGLTIGKIGKELQVDRKTVARIIKEKGEIPDTVRSDVIDLDPALLRRLYSECKGYIQRVHEKLEEEHGVTIGYSTLTRKVRELGLGQPKNQRCDQVPDEPGKEMQHDTTVYKIRLGEKNARLVASLLYFRYSKSRYLKFYFNFNRFKMKCFFHQALMHFGYSAPDCVIDNTNLARLRGIGKNAVMVPEMKQFGARYGFEFICHEKGHASRKAGNERSFYTVETNFLPGRRFESIEDLNQQALDWATVKFANRPVSKTGLIPARAFEYGGIEDIQIFDPGLFQAGIYIVSRPNKFIAAVFAGIAILPESLGSGPTGPDLNQLIFIGQIHLGAGSALDFTVISIQAVPQKGMGLVGFGRKSQGLLLSGHGGGQFNAFQGRRDFITNYFNFDGLTGFTAGNAIAAVMQTVWGPGHGYILV